MDNKIFTFQHKIDFMIRDGSTFMDEGKVMLIGEFGKEYGVYFSILSAIARGESFLINLYSLMPIDGRYVEVQNKKGNRMVTLCDSCRIQTCNLLIRSQMLYSVELTNHFVVKSFPICECKVTTFF